MEAELASLLHEQTKGEVVSEDRIQWQVIRALSKTMGHLSKDAIRKKGKRMLLRQEAQQTSMLEQAKRRKRTQTEQSVLPGTEASTSGLQPAATTAPSATLAPSVTGPSPAAGAEGGKKASPSASKSGKGGGG
eukprot:scaffold19272_cov50-Prasinocladus_malaysianus.AAC.2